MNSPVPVAGQDWYEIIHLGNGISLIRERYVADWLRCNIWHIQGRNRDLLVDSGLGLRPLKPEIMRLSEKPLIAVMSHCHFDHIGAGH
ncbi:MAG: MBL fold metallo-hydrolase [Gammaproteobacteria bacterium]|nr:MBL fold metallo-hydrolase [Gammaproteobacteria bacterium]